MVQPTIDRESLEKFLQGETTAFGQVYDKTAKMIYNVIYRIVMNKHDAEDITHDTYLRAFEKRQSFNRASDLPTWLYKIAVNNALNFCNRRKYTRTLLEKLAQFFGQQAGEAPPPSPEEEKSNVQLVQKLLGKIKPEFRTCLVLCEMENKSYQQIADILKINIGTVRSRINRGKKELKRLYDKIGNNYGQ